MPEYLRDNRYRVDEEIHHGAQGFVYKAYDTKLDQPVAVKEMLDRFTSGDDRDYALRRFREEAQILFTLNHPSLPRVTDFFEEAGRYYLVMSLVEGTDLQSLMERGENVPLPPGRVESWARQILEVLHYLHTLDPPVIYRDIKPSNLMLDDKDNIYMVDFGIARIFDKKKKGTSIGTPGFSPPEQYKGFTEPGSDLFSLGATLHYLLTGIDPADPANPPFTFDDIKKYNPEIPENFRRLIFWLLEFSADKRPPSAGKALRVLNGDEPFPDPDPERKEETPEPALEKPRSEVLPEKKSPVNWLIPLLLILIIIGTVFVFLPKTEKSSSPQSGEIRNSPDRGKMEKSPYVNNEGVTPTAQGDNTSSPQPVDIPGFVLNCHIARDGVYEKGWISHTAVSGDAKLVAAGYPDGDVVIWDFDTKKPVKTLREHTNSIRNVSFSKDGRYLVSCGEDKNVIVWDLKNEKPIFRLTAVSIPVQGEISPDNKFIHYTDFDKKYYKVSMDKKILETTRGTAFDISPDGKFIIINEFPNGFKLKDLKSGWHEIYRFNEVRWIRKLRFSRDGSLVAIATSDSKVFVVDLKKKEIVKTLKAPVRFAMAVDFSPDGKYVASVFEDETIVIWELADEKIADRIRPQSFFYHMGGGGAEDLQYTPDGKYLIFGDLMNVRAAENPFYGK